MAAVEQKQLGSQETGALPNWGGNGSMSEFFGPPQVGSEKVIKDTIRTLWPMR